MSRHDMTCLATESWQMSRHVAMFRRPGEIFRSARCARRLRVCFGMKYREIAPKSRNLMLNGRRNGNNRTKISALAPEIFFKIAASRCQGVITLTAVKMSWQMSRHDVTFRLIPRFLGKCHDMSSTLLRPKSRQMSQRMSRHLRKGQPPARPDDKGSSPSTC